MPGRYRLPFAVFGAIWLTAMAYLAVRGLRTWLAAGAGAALALSVFVWLTFRVTRGRPALPEGGDPAARAEADESRAAPPHGEDPPAVPDHGEAAPESEGRRRLLAQLVVALTLAVLAILRFHGIPVWSGLIEGLYTLGNAVPAPNANYVVNPILYIVIPGALVLVLGATPRGIGFRKGWRPLRVIAVWSAPVLGIWAWALFTGRTGIGRIARLLLSNTFQNGVGEEVLWRGIIQTRIARLWTPEWGLVLASLAFGWWHIDSIPDWAGDDLWLAAALNVVVQAPMGLALGLIFDRTRNLLAPSVVHIVANSVDV